MDTVPAGAHDTTSPCHGPGRFGEGDASDLDHRVVAGQIGRTPRALAGIAARCPFGLPAVTRQAPTDERGRPFPTAYYVTCPHLVRQVDRLESDGGVRRFEQALEGDEGLRAATAAAHRTHATLDDRGSGIAGSPVDSSRLKCLHAHAGFALAGHDHPLGQQVLREAAPAWCSTARCLAFAGDEPAASKLRT
jgi:hypothetical protein